MKMKALFEQLIVKTIEAETIRGGLYIPDNLENTRKATVLSVGHEVASSFKEGDVILFPKNKGYAFKFEGSDYTQLNALDVIAVLEN
jgi:co-chaperonin GroES (HSP10)